MSKMKLNIVTPEEVVYDDDIEMVIVRTIDGDRGIMPRHAPLITGLDIGTIRIKANNEEHVLAATKGYMEVQPEETTILVDSAEFAKEIDVERAKAAKKRAEERLNSPKDNINEKRAELALQRALNRLKASKGRNFE
ncbi:F0F1 ATP synthase subunit epsilon [Natroniella sulfidigena]|uniref:F0F1 ATP synthase subunit epsilon n=1 Tax=Natroniella sulfidigena TaxID=723921 RepID=UPI00200AF3BD|nr:F0F1 ATP synthase subunit epsilon [Natroniella sulfidigena]MCK8816390.1 F0F1 ATP synthase subunit epsilon [Natroniella sulfidigena]